MKWGIGASIKRHPLLCKGMYQITLLLLIVSFSHMIFS